MPVQLRNSRVEGSGEREEGGVQLPAHTRPLRSLAGEQERDLALGGLLGYHRAVGHRLQCGGEFRAAGAGGDRTVGEP